MSQIVRYKKGRVVFEVVTKPGSVRKYRAGKLGWNNVLIADQVFSNFKKGNVAKSSDLVSVFGTNNSQTILETIVREGELCVSAAERKEDMDAHRRQVIGYLHKTYVDASGLPHPVTRLEGTVDESKVRLDVAVNPKKQAEEVVKKMLGKLVFKKSSMEFTLFLEHKYAKKCQGIVYKNCEVSKESWDQQGCRWILLSSPGDFDGFVAEMNKVTSGDYLLAMGRKDPRESVPEEEQDDNRKRKPRKRDKKKNRRRK
jgi:ribosome maturation protein SDO1